MELVSKHSTGRRTEPVIQPDHTWPDPLCRRTTLFIKLASCASRKEHGASVEGIKIKFRSISADLPRRVAALLSIMTDLVLTTADIPDRGPAVFAVTTATLVIATFFLIARLICRTIIVKRVSWDDYFVIFAWFLCAGLSIAIDIGASKGLGRHDADIDERDLLPLRKTEYVFSVLYVCLSHPSLNSIGGLQHTRIRP